MKDYTVIKKLRLFRYDESVHDSVPYEVPIYSIPLNKKGYCKQSVSIHFKNGEEKEIPRCQNFYKRDCAECVNLAKKLYKENH